MLLATPQLPHVHTDVHMDLGSLPLNALEDLRNTWEFCAPAYSLSIPFKKVFSAGWQSEAQPPVLPIPEVAS